MWSTLRSSHICVYVLSATGPIFMIRKPYSKALGPKMCTDLLISPWEPLELQKGPWSLSLSGTYLNDYWAIFYDSKAI